MIITRVRLQGFRNYESVDISFPKSIIVFYGRNGQGKTNLLESMYTGCIGKSYRGVGDIDILRQGSNEGSVIIDFVRNNVEQEVKIIFSRFEKKSAYINDTKVKIKELFGTLQAVMFSPDDLQLIKGTPLLRRRFMDMEISQVNQTYYHLLLQYNRAVAQRNILLRKMKYKRCISLDEWDEQLAQFSAEIVKKRLESLKKIRLMAGIIYKRLTRNKENLTLTYVQPYNKDIGDEQNITDPEWYYRLLKKNRQYDIYRISTSVGPHRDDLILGTEAGNLRRFGSQGQQRTAVLALKLSELEFIKSESGEYPVLLLDDVMSELDEERRNSLLEFVHERIQTFITATDDAVFRKKKEYHFLHVVNGKVEYD